MPLINMTHILGWVNYQASEAEVLEEWKKTNKHQNIKHGAHK